MIARASAVVGAVPNISMPLHGISAAHVRASVFILH